jgi:hypothetical protein
MMQPRDILTLHEKHISKLRANAHLTDVQFDQLIMPLLEKMADYMSVLPASEGHHHSYYTGMFKHALEVGFIAGGEGANMQFVITPKRDASRLIQNRAWETAAAVCGCLHDIAKIETDFVVKGRTQQDQWVPQRMGLGSWASAGGHDRIMMQWRDNRGGLHHTHYTAVLARFMPAELRDYFLEIDPDIIKAMETLYSAQPISPRLSELVKQADHRSTRFDLTNVITAMPEANGPAPHERILNAIEEWLYAGEWTYNTNKGKVWFINGETFVDWEYAYADIVKLIRAETLGISTDKGAIAEHLIKKGSAVAFEQQGVNNDRYWPIAPSRMRRDSGTRKMRWAVKLAVNLAVADTVKQDDGLVGEAVLRYAHENTRVDELRATIPLDNPQSIERETDTTQSRAGATTGEIIELFEHMTEEQRAKVRAVLELNAEPESKTDDETAGTQHTKAAMQNPGDQPNEKPNKPSGAKEAVTTASGEDDEKKRAEREAAVAEIIGKPKPMPRRTSLGEKLDKAQKSNSGNTKKRTGGPTGQIALEAKYGQQVQKIVEALLGIIQATPDKSEKAFAPTDNNKMWLAYPGVLDEVATRVGLVAHRDVYTALREANAINQDAEGRAIHQQDPEGSYLVLQRAITTPLRRELGPNWQAPRRRPKTAEIPNPTASKQRPAAPTFEPNAQADAGDAE